MLGRLFKAHGEFCASHPLEVVIATITVIISLVSMGSAYTVNSDLSCGWDYECAKSQKLKKSDVMWLSFARCVALVFVYVQFRNLRRVGTKHVLGISGLFTIFSSFIFCIAFVKMFGNTMSGLYEALPFFLFLVDLSKASGMAVFALSSTHREELRSNIGRGMQLLGPAITLDALVETLAIGLGTNSGVQQLETMCSFGCLSVVANYVAFMTFYPACLSLVLELSMDLGESRGEAVGQYKRLVSELLVEHEHRKPNPVIQRVKLIMSAGLAVVHLHSHLVTPGSVTMTTSLQRDSESVETPEPEMSWIQAHLYSLFAVHVDYGLTLILGLVLLVKYMVVDRHTDLLDIQTTLKLERSLRSVDAGTQTDPDDEDTVDGEDIRTSFSIGDDEDVYTETYAASKPMEDKTIQASLLPGVSPLRRLISDEEPRPVQECLEILKHSENGASELTDAEIRQLVSSRHIPAYKLEGSLGDHERGVAIRRQIISDSIAAHDAMDNLPYSNYEYSYVDGACCENVVGYMPVPVGVAGPLLLDGRLFTVPMATTEGCLVASTNRGCSALRQSGGVHSVLIGDGMSRAPVVRLPTARRASELKFFFEDDDNFSMVREVFNSTSRFAKLHRLQVVQAGRLLYVRFVAQTGDAMGMNMVSKGTEKALHMIQERFGDMEILSLSGNLCTDKKPSAINWIEGRGKSVVCEAVVPASVVKNTLKTSVQTLVDLNINKNLIGSAMAGSVGGYNAHAANIVTAVFIATGQDPAQTVASSNCITLLEATGQDGEDLYISCTMPSLEVGTVGGGTILPPQAACLQMLGVKGSSLTDPGENAGQLARVICGTVLAGELSLLSALAAGHLVRSHLKHNRSSISMASFQGGFSPSPSRASMPNVDLLRATLMKSADKMPDTQTQTPTARTTETQPQKLTNTHTNAIRETVASVKHEQCDNKHVENTSPDNVIKTIDANLRHRRQSRSDEASLGKDIGSCISHVS